MKNNDNDNNIPDIIQSAIDNLQAGENITIGDVVQNNQTFGNSSAASYNHIKTILDRYKQKKTSIAHDYRIEKQRNREYLCLELRNYSEEIFQEINDIKGDNDKDNQQHLRDLKKDVNKIKAAIKRLEQLLRPDIDEMKIIHVLENELLKNLSDETEEKIQAIKRDYESRQESSEEDFEEQLENCEEERDIGIYKHELVQKLVTDGYPLRRESQIYLERISSDFNFDESVINSVEQEIIEPFYEENLRKYEQVYEQKLEQEGFPLSFDTIDELEELEKRLGLPEYEFEYLSVRDSEKQIVKPFYRVQFWEFERIFKQKLEQESLSYNTIIELDKLEISLGLYRFSFEDLNLKETKVKLIKLPYQNNLQKYEQTYREMIEQKGFPLSSSDVEYINNCRDSLCLRDSYFALIDIEDCFSPDADSENIEKLVIRPFYHENVKKYGKAYEDKIEEGKTTVRADIYSDLESLRQELGIRDEDSKIVESLVYKGFKVEHFVDSYYELRELLIDAKWQEADEKTRIILFKIAGIECTEKIDDKSVQKFPNQDIYIIDRLWVEYSKGRFGFSVQKRIFDEVKQNRQKFGEKVGWSNKAGFFRGMFSWIPYDKLNFTLNAPEGHLPVWAAKDKKIFTDDFHHLKIWDFRDNNSSSALVHISAYNTEYSEEAFWQKIRKFAQKLGEGTIEQVLLLFYAAKQPNVPLAAKAAMLGALGYFILPFDLITDFIPFVGWTDDVTALGAALSSAASYITSDVREQVKEKMQEIFGK